MMQWIYNLNSWYDKQPEPRRFALFIIPMTLAVLLTSQNSSLSLKLVGLFFICLMGILRIWVFAFPRKGPPKP